jgi:hypothetical protein
MDLVATGGGSPQQAKKAKKRTAMQGVKLGTWIILASVLYTLPVLLLTAIDDDFAALLLVSLATFLVGFFRLLYAVFVQERRERKETEGQASPGLLSAPGAVNVPKQLGQPAGVPVDTLTRPIKITSEVKKQASITENTTRFLDDEKDSQLQRKSQ